MKKRLFMLAFSVITSSSVFALTVYDPANHQQNVQNYQMMILQRLEMIKTATENATQTIQQAKQLEHDMTNLQQLAGGLLGDEAVFLTQALKDLNAINKNSESILKESKNLDENFGKIYIDKNKLSKLSNQEILWELEKISNQRKANVKDNLKTAVTVIELNEKDTTQMTSYMSSTDGASGNLQAQMATKKGIDQLNNRTNRLAELQAQQMILEAEKVAQEEAITNIQKEIDDRAMKMDPVTEKNLQIFKK